MSINHETAGVGDTNADSEHLNAILAARLVELALVEEDIKDVVHNREPVYVGHYTNANDGLVSPRADYKRELAELYVKQEELRNEIESLKSRIKTTTP